MNFTLPIMILIFALVMWRRLNATRKPIRSGIRLVLPLLFLTPGFAMFSNPQLHPTTKEIVISVILGLVMSIPMILTTNYELRNDGQIYAKKSVAFIASLLILLAVRFGLRDLFQQDGQMVSSMMLYLVAVSYVVPWRVACLVKYLTTKRMVGSAAQVDML